MARCIDGRPRGTSSQSRLTNLAWGGGGSDAGPLARSAPRRIPRRRTSVDCKGVLMSSPDRTRELDDVLFERILAVVAPGDEIYTLTSKLPNRIVSIERNGIEVETLRSEHRDSGPQLVPAWMIVAAWTHLRRNGQLSQ